MSRNTGTIWGVSLVPGTEGHGSCGVMTERAHEFSKAREKTRDRQDETARQLKGTIRYQKCYERRITYVQMHAICSLQSFSSTERANSQR